jgi:hypothetical protein
VTQLELLAKLIAVLEESDVPYAIVGSFASSIWGEPRLTLDIDVVVQLLPAHVDAVMAAFPAPDYYVSRVAIDEAIRLASPFNVIHPLSGNKIDFMVVGTGTWAENQLARRQRIELLPNIRGYVAAPDDVIVGKLVYYHEGGSDKHLRDIAGILKRSRELVDRDYVSRLAHELGVDDAWQLAVVAAAD